MPGDANLVFYLIGLTAVMMASNRVRYDLIALLVLVTLALTGILTPSEAVAGFVAAYEEHPWHEFLGGLKPLVDSYVERFAEIAEAGPAEDQEVLQSMVVHEQAFVSWIDKEMAGDSGSLDAAIAQLKFPLPVPATP